ncbi:MAG: hypothetical protein JO296_02535 [Pseudonocardiales bacterium]|nr:hypothetical protein [Pseudonocardiales bacterium]MBV9649001.1 hypothetical protein [Pseudonocardiales bacterium]
MSIDITNVDAYRVITPNNGDARLLIFLPTLLIASVAPDKVADRVMLDVGALALAMGTS